MEQASSSSNELLLPDSVHARRKCGSLFVSSLKWVIKSAIFGAFTAWIALVFAFPLQSMSTVISGWLDYFGTTPLGFTGTYQNLLFFWKKEKFASN